MTMGLNSLPEMRSNSVFISEIEWDLSVTRDMELIREIIAEIETWPDTKPRTVKLDGRDFYKVQDHVSMLASAGLVTVANQFASGKGQQLFINDLSWDGHEFAAALKTPTVLESMRNKVGSAMSTLPLKVLYQVSMSLATEWAKKQVGLNN